ncbi:MAG TPA: di-heme oxidoredictase family protein, partial [Candidatus Udaeobacter sp.]|nr:di-heme oxidoredictase family protein [Candidatus Udaeobacter sp.]
PAVSETVIHPYTDLLLHDLGPELSDGMPEGNAQPAEWRTAPLWGLGLAERVDGYRFLLHDGRARTPEEAILWHGGEASASRDAFRQLPAQDRRDLLAFLESL